MRRGFLFSCRAQPQIAPYLGSGEGKMEITKDYWRENQDLDENGNHSDHASICSLTSFLVGRSSSFCASAHAYGPAENHPGSGALCSRTLCPLRSARLWC